MTRMQMVRLLLVHVNGKGDADIALSASVLVSNGMIGGATGAPDISDASVAVSTLAKIVAALDTDVGDWLDGPNDSKLTRPSFARDYAVTCRKIARAFKGCAEWFETAAVETEASAPSNGDAVCATPSPATQPALALKDGAR
jgi:hypothetical protein